ncbi:hypothetical protein AK812_SmicGene17893 [Symbiodinium microadriaticum]|uniref:Uncharacterized protein n=1 Tax=Symbiodinium microadriaticum TaxID=2951 RepID=A0A1Q9DWK8_SYMMI|nr:hypothetical protein AK812_SmicGene17893 [Symbiodinium microadriaticum]
MARALAEGEGLLEIEVLDGKVWQVPVDREYWFSLSKDQQMILMVKIRDQIEGGFAERDEQGVFRFEVGLGCDCLPHPASGASGSGDGEKEDKPKAEGEKKEDEPKTEGDEKEDKPKKKKKKKEVKPKVRTLAVLAAADASGVSWVCRLFVFADFAAVAQNARTCFCYPGPGPGPTTSNFDHFDLRRALKPRVLMTAQLRQWEPGARSRALAVMASLEGLHRTMANQQEGPRPEHCVAFIGQDMTYRLSSILMFFDAALFSEALQALPYAKNAWAPCHRACWVVETEIFQSAFLKSEVCRCASPSGMPLAIEKSSLLDLLERWKDSYQVSNHFPEVCFTACPPLAVLCACNRWPLLAELPRSSAFDLTRHRGSHASACFKELFAWPDLVFSREALSTADSVPQDQATASGSEQLKLDLATWGHKVLTRLKAVSSEPDDDMNISALETQLEFMLHNANSVHALTCADDNISFPKRRQGLYRADNVQEQQGPNTRGLNKLSSKVLVHAISCCLHLRDSKDLGEQAMSMVRLVLPELAGSIEHRVQQLPAVATISKGRAAVDVGLMLFMKQVNDSLIKSCLRKFLQSVRSVTTDFGVEHGFAESRNIRLHDLFSHVEDLNFADCHGTDESVQPQAGETPLPYLFDHALQTPGALHILHSASKELTDGFEHFDSFFFPLLQATTNSLSKPDVQDRFIQYCLVGSPAACFAKQVKEFHASLAHWRWGTLIQACQGLLVLQTPLTFWSNDRVQSGSAQDEEDAGRRQAGQQERDEGESSQSQLSKVGEAVHDPTFWAYVRMVDVCSKVLDHLEHFFESCPCHHKPKPFDSNTIFFRSRQSCIMCGRRAPEMSAGMLEHVLAQHLDSGRAELVLICSGLSDEGSAMILSEWSASTARLATFLKLKFAFWGNLPHKLAAIGHHDESMARSVLKQCLSEYLATLQDESEFERARHHRLTLMYFGPGPLKEEIDQFLAGSSRTSLPRVMHEAAAMSLIMLTERSIEGRHALAGAKSKLMKCLRAAAFSLALRSAELHKRCLASVGQIDYFVGRVAHARAASSLLVVTSLTMHPWAQHLESQGLPLKLGEVIKIIYHCDLYTMMLPHEEATAALSGPSLPPTMGPRLAWQSEFRTAKSAVEKEQIVFKHSMAQHFQQTCPEGTYFTCYDMLHSCIVPATQQLKSQPASRALRGSPVTPSAAGFTATAAASASEGTIHLFNFATMIDDATATDSQLNLSMCNDIRVENSVGQCMPAAQLAQQQRKTPKQCFRVVKSNPKGQKRNRLGETFAPGFKSTDVLVSMHSVKESGTANELVVDACPQTIGSDLAGVFKFARPVTFDEAEQLGKFWQVRGSKLALSSLLFQQVSNQDLAQELVQRMLRQLAVTSSCNSLTVHAESELYDEEVRCLSEMEALQIVRCVDKAEDSSSWALFSAWINRVQVTTALQQPRPLFHHDLGDDLPMLQWTDFRLMHFLHSKQWQMVTTRPHREKKSAIEPYMLDSDNALKQWYLEKGLPHHEYLVVLAQSEQAAHELCFPAGQDRCIKHLASTNYYKRLLGVTNWKSKRGKNLMLQFQEPEPADDMLAIADNCERPARKRRPGRPVRSSLPGAGRVDRNQSPQPEREGRGPKRRVRGKTGDASARAARVDDELPLPAPATPVRSLLDGVHPGGASPAAGSQHADSEVSWESRESYTEAQVLRELFSEVESELEDSGVADNAMIVPQQDHEGLIPLQAPVTQRNGICNWKEKMVRKRSR